MLISLCICIFAASFTLSFIPYNSYAFEKEISAVFLKHKLSPDTKAKGDDKTQGIQLDYAALKIIKNYPGKKLISIKRFKNKSFFAYTGRNNFNKQITQVVSENSGLTYVNLAFLKFLRVTKLLC